MISTGRRGWRSWSPSMRRMPSVGSMRRSSKARSKRDASVASRALRGSLVAVTSNPIAVRRISSTSRIAASSSTTRTFCFTAESLPLFQLQVDLLESLEIGAQLVGFLAHLRQVALALGELLAHTRELLVEPRDLVAGRHDRGDRVAARPHPLRGEVVMREVPACTPYARLAR